MSSNVGFYPLVPSWPNKYSKCDLKSCIFGQICSQLFLSKSASFQFFTKKKSFNPKNLLREHILESFKVSESVSTFILSQKMSLIGLICSRSIWEHDFGYFVRFHGQNNGHFEGFVNFWPEISALDHFTIKRARNYMDIAIRNHFYF